jgi:EmrB/QacA subfamily drug resistance transporter
MKVTAMPVGHGSRTRWIGLFGVGLASFVGCIDFTIVNTAIPDIQNGLSASVSEAQWIVTAFVMALSAFMVVAGRLADLYGRRAVLYVVMAVFGLASAAAGAASSIEMLIAWRFIQGASAAGLYTASAAIVSNAFPEEERGRAIGLLFAGNGIGLAIGPVAGGLLVGFLGWRWVFFVNVPFLLISAALCLASIHESRDDTADRAIDWSGVAFLITGLTCLLLGITQGMNWGWLSLPTLAAILGGLLLLGGFILLEERVAAPLINLDLFANRRFAAASVATCALAFFYCSAFFLMPLYLSVVRGDDSTLTGLMLLSTTALVAITSPVAGHLTDRHGPVPLIAGGLILLAVSAGLQTLFSNVSSPPLVIGAFMVMGIGWGCILGPSTVAALTSVPDRLGGAATGASWTIHNIGGAIGLVLSTLVYRLAAGSAISRSGQFATGADPTLLGQLVAEPTQAAERLAAVTGGPADPAAFVEAYFMSGYRAAMGLLVVTTLLAFVANITLVRPLSTPARIDQES